MSHEHAPASKSPAGPAHLPAVVSRLDPRVRAQRAEIRSILRGAGVQPKLTVGAPGDEHEREADRVADDVMRMPDPGPSTPAIQRECEGCEEDEAQ